MSFISIVVFVLVFGLVVLVHELGHFWAARRFGVGVDEFGLGMPPRIWGKKVGETVYSINWIPFGGFVRLQGEGEAEPVDVAKSLRHKGFWKRLTVIVAGVIMNFVLAYVLIAVGFWFGMPPLATDPVRLVTDPNKIEEQVRIIGVQPDSPAERIGILKGDAVLTIDGVEITSTASLQETVAKAQASVAVVVKRGNQTLTFDVEPATTEGRQVIGVFTQEMVGRVNYVWWQVPWLAAQDFGAAVVGVGKGITGFFAGLVTTGRVSEDVTGPLGIAQITGRVVELGILTLMQFVAMLSINLGFVNILPIPALDGGRLLMLILEAAVPARKWNYRLEAGVHSFGFLLLFVLILLVTYKDIVRIF